jgi:mRNA-degrading endonuclease toxin of MazEF toxin-antitoxin module
MKNDFQLGDVVLVNLPITHTHIQGKSRPCIVLGNKLALRYSPVITVIPLTGKCEKRMDISCHVVIGPDETNNGLTRNSVVLCEQLTTVPKEWVFAHKGRLTSHAVGLVMAAVKRQLVG